jgi:hypothetical protein
MEYKAYSRGEVAATEPVTKRRKAAKSKARSVKESVVGLESGILSFNSDEAADLARCMTKPQRTRAAILRGAALLRKLYPKSR